MKSIHSLIVCTGLTLLVGCASQPPYEKSASVTHQAGDNIVRYGSIAGVGAGGYFAGKEIGGSETAGALGAAIGVGTTYMLHKYYDDKRQESYEVGIADGAAAARAEILNEKWRREAVYGLPAEGKMAQNPTYRTRYVPSRESNGVKYEGNYQTVPVYK